MTKKKESLDNVQQLEIIPNNTVKKVLPLAPAIKVVSQLKKAMPTQQAQTNTIIVQDNAKVGVINNGKIDSLTIHQNF